MKNKDVFTVFFHPDRNALKLETNESGLDVKGVNMGIGLREEESFADPPVVIVVPLNEGRNEGTFLGGKKSVEDYENITEALSQEAINKSQRLKAAGSTPHSYKYQKFYGVSTKEEIKKEDRIRLVGPGERIYLLGDRYGYGGDPMDMFLEFSFSPGI